MDEVKLSKLLFEARELISMFDDIVRGRGGDSLWTERVIKEIDAYRAEKGWSPNGFGGEVEVHKPDKTTYCGCPITYIETGWVNHNHPCQINTAGSSTIQPGLTHRMDVWPMT